MAVPEQIVAIRPKVSSVTANVAAVAADVRQIPAGIAQAAGSQIAIEIVIVLVQAGPIAPEIELIGSDVAFIAADVGATPLSGNVNRNVAPRPTSDSTQM